MGGGGGGGLTWNSLTNIKVAIYHTSPVGLDIYINKYIMGIGACVNSDYLNIGVFQR